MQYNYSHGNEGAGYLFAQFSGASAMSNNIARYNISENDGRKNGYGAITLWSAGGYRMDNTEIYGNTLFVSPAATGSPSGVYVFPEPPPAIPTSGTILSLPPEASDCQCHFHLRACLWGNAYWSSGSAFSINWGGTNYTSLSGFKTTGQESGTGIQADPMLNNPNAGVTIGNTKNLCFVNRISIKNGFTGNRVRRCDHQSRQQGLFWKPVGAGYPVQHWGASG
jgi:hypothetical protein